MAMLQLGAALLASGDRPETLDFVTLDQPLGRCAQLEGFRVHPTLSVGSAARRPGRTPH